MLSTLPRTTAHVRWMIRRDMPDVLAAESFRPEPWDEPAFLEHLKERNVIAMVAEVGETAVGCMVYELHKTKLVLVRLTVHPDWRRQGVGSQLLDKLRSKLSAHRRNRVVVDVPEEDLDAQLFLRANEFEAVNYRSNNPTIHFVARCEG